jgi:hypothetical protein
MLAETSTSFDELPDAALAEKNGVGVFRLHKVIGFADDLVPLKMTEVGNNPDGRGWKYRPPVPQVDRRGKEPPPQSSSGSVGGV